MKPRLLAVLAAVALLAGCAGPATLKSPCVGASDSPCDRTPLISEAIT